MVSGPACAEGSESLLAAGAADQPQPQPNRGDVETERDKAEEHAARRFADRRAQRGPAAAGRRSTESLSGSSTRAPVKTHVSPAASTKPVARRGPAGSADMATGASL